MKTIRQIADEIGVSKQAVFKNQASHNPNSPLIFGELGEQDVVKPRKEKDVKSLKQPQQSLF